MNVNVPDYAKAHFWVEPPPGHMEFWSLRFKPVCKVGDPIVFSIDGEIVASAVIHSIEAPGKSSCAGTGKFGGRWKVFWQNETFKDLRPKVVQHGDGAGGLFGGNKA